MIVIFLRFIVNQKEKRGFIWSETFYFLFQKPSNFYLEKKSCSFKVAVFEFQKYRKKELSIFVKFLKINMNMNFSTGIFQYF